MERYRQCSHNMIRWSRVGKGGVPLVPHFRFVSYPCLDLNRMHLITAVVHFKSPIPPERRKSCTWVFVGLHFSVLGSKRYFAFRVYLAVLLDSLIFSVLYIFAKNLFRTDCSRGVIDASNF